MNKKLLTLLMALTMMFAFTGVAMAEVLDTDVAKIDDVGYATLQEAITAAGTSEVTITLLSNVTEDVTIPENANIVLELANFTLDCTDAFTVINNGTLILQNGTVSNSMAVDYNSNITIKNNGNLTVDNCTLEITCTTWNYGGIAVIQCLNNSELLVKGATVINSTYNGINLFNNAKVTIDYATINAGTIYAELTDPADSSMINPLENDAKYWDKYGSAIDVSDDSTLIVNDGIFDADGSCILSTTSESTTINDGTFTAGGSALVNWGGTVTIKDGTFTGNGFAALEISDNGCYGDDYVAGTTTVTGGEFTGVYYGVYMDAGTVNITGGMITGIWCIFQYGGTLNLTGGTITGSSWALVAGQDTVTTCGGEGVSGPTLNAGVATYSTTTGQDITVYSGFFKTYDTSISSNVVDGYMISPLTNENGYYTIIEDEKVAIVTSSTTGEKSEAMTLGTAIAAANSGDTVTLLSDVALSYYFTIDESITLDLAGNTITTSGRVQVSATADDIVTIKNGTIASTADFGVMNFGGHMILDNVTVNFTGTNHAVYVASGVTDVIECNINATVVGVYVTSATGDKVTISDCTITDCSYGVFAYTESTAPIEITGSTITGSSYGLICYNSSQVDITDTTINATNITADCVSVSYDCELNIGSGTIINNGVDNAETGICIIGKTTGSPKVTIEDGAEVYGYYAVFIVGAYGNGVAAGDVADGSIPELIINGGIIGDESSMNAVIGNGSNDYTYIEINGGTLTGGQNMAISHPQTGNLVITGGTIQGPTGIQYGGNGTVTITGGTIIGTDVAVDLYKSSLDSDGALSEAGAALVLASRGGGYQDSGRTMTVNISGGTFESYNNEPIMVIRMGKDDEWVFNSEDSETYKNYLESLTITGGTFIGADQISIEPLAASENVVEITGGEFEVKPDTSLLADGKAINLETNEKGYYTIGDFDNVQVELLAKADSTLVGDANDITEAAGVVASVDNDELLNHIDDVNALDELYITANSYITVTGDADGTNEVTKIDVAGLAIAALGGTTVDTDTTLTLEVTDSSAELDDIVADNDAIDELNEDAIVLDIKAYKGEDQINNADLKAPVTFTLYLADDFEGDYVKIYHIKSDNTVDTYTKTVYTDEYDKKYITLTVTEFSNFVIESYKYSVSYTYYDIDLTTTGEGTITPTGGDNATITTAKGGSRMFTFTPADGYEIADVIVDGDSVGAVDTYYFASISADHTLEVVFTAEDGSTTVDNSLNAMDEDAYYYNAILWAIEEGMIDADDETLTTIVDGSTRAESVYFMWVAYGSPVVNIENPFTDIDTDDYYYNAVLWAYSVGITAGTTTTTFSPDDVCTRAQIASFIHRAEGEPTVESDNDFTDVVDGAYYANAINWAVSEEIVAGMTTSTFEPSTDCARTHILTFLYRYLG